MMIDVLPFEFFFAARLETTSKSNSLLSLAVFSLFVLLTANTISFHFISFLPPVQCLSYSCMLKDSSADNYPNFQPLYYFQCASVLCNPSNSNFPKLRKGNIITYPWIERDRDRERGGGCRRGRGDTSSLAGGQTGWGCGFFVLHPHNWQMFHTNL